MGARVNGHGLLIAVIGFGLTRFTVSLAFLDDPLRFYVAGVVPLLLGLGLAAFGVTLVVADVDDAIVRKTAQWCVVGTATMAVLVLLTLAGSSPDGPLVAEFQSQLYLSNYLIAGSVGGTLTGLYAARTDRQHAALRQQANRLEVLNRMLRHEVLNAVTAIQGYADLDPARHPDAPNVIRARSRHIATTIDDVRFLAQRTNSARNVDASVDPDEILERSVETARESYPDATISVDAPRVLPSVTATDRLELVFDHLLDNAIVHAPDDEPTVAVRVRTTPTRLRVSVVDDGPGLPDAQQALLETGDITRYDDPSDGYGLNVVRLLVEHFGGAIEIDPGADGTTITVSLPRADTRNRGIRSSPSGLTGIHLNGPHLVVTLGAAVLAGIAYGVVSESFGGSVAAIGVFYGISNPVVGWITHVFHSAVFAFIYAGFLTHLPMRHQDDVTAYVAVALAWGVALWVGAAGIIAPVWLTLLGFDVPIPNLSGLFLATHLVWGGALGLLTALGYRHVSPRLAMLYARYR